MHFMFWNLNLGVFENFWGFSKLMSYCWNFWDGFWRFNLKNFMHFIPYHAFSYVQIDCILVGLDLVEPMIQFLLYVTCSCIPHAYVLYFQYTCYIWNLFGAFLIVSFFPFSFLFTLVTSVTPKRKSTSSQNPHCSTFGSLFTINPLILLL